MTGMDMSSKDLEKNPKASVTMSLAQVWAISIARK